ncbi:hypothetical protein BIW11_04444, partial [Tropilaelaps mercedesae]
MAPATALGGCVPSSTMVPARFDDDASSGAPSSPLPLGHPLAPSTPLLGSGSLVMATAGPAGGGTHERAFRCSDSTGQLSPASSTSSYAPHDGSSSVSLYGESIYPEVKGPKLIDDQQTLYHPQANYPAQVVPQIPQTPQGY